MAIPLGEIENGRIAQLWKTGDHWLMEICAGLGGRVIVHNTFKSKVDAKAFAKSEKARPWNY